jgi:hypothetical protein
MVLLPPTKPPTQALALLFPTLDLVLLLPTRASVFLLSTQPIVLLPPTKASVLLLLQTKASVLLLPAQALVLLLPAQASVLLLLPLDMVLLSPTKASVLLRLTQALVLPLPPLDSVLLLLNQASVLLSITQHLLSNLFNNHLFSIATQDSAFNPHLLHLLKANLLPIPGVLLLSFHQPKLLNKVQLGVSSLLSLPNQLLHRGEMYLLRHLKLKVTHGLPILLVDGLLAVLLGKWASSSSWIISALGFLQFS